MPQLFRMATADGDAPALLLLNFDAASARFLLCASRSPGASHSSQSNPPSSFLKRDLNDLRRWDRALHQRGNSPGGALPRLPMKKLRKLMELSWVKDDLASGWRLELQKNVAACEAWINAALASLPDAERSEFLDDELYERAQERRGAERAAVKGAKDLQQYFTSQPLVERLVATVKARVGEMGASLDDVLFLEPSFGDGRIVSALVDAGARRVVGYEIDESLLQRAVAKTEHHQSKVHLVSGDFLASTRADAAVWSDCKTIITVGNPPFGDKKADNSIEQHKPPMTDLVARFMAHSAAEWRACLLVFIVPERCGKPAFVQSALDALDAASGCDQWQLERCESLDGHTFELGSKRVKQPSVLQIYSHLETS